MPEILHPLMGWVPDPDYYRGFYESMLHGNPFYWQIRNSPDPIINPHLHHAVHAHTTHNSQPLVELRAKIMDQIVMHDQEIEQVKEAFRKTQAAQENIQLIRTFSENFSLHGNLKSIEYQAGTEQVALDGWKRDGYIAYWPWEFENPLYHPNTEFLPSTRDAHHICRIGLQYYLLGGLPYYSRDLTHTPRNPHQFSVHWDERLRGSSAGDGVLKQKDHEPSTQLADAFRLLRKEKFTFLGTHREIPSAAVYGYQTTCPRCTHQFQIQPHHTYIEDPIPPSPEGTIPIWCDNCTDVFVVQG